MTRGMTDRLVWRAGGVNFDALAQMRITNFKAFMAFMQDLWKVAGYKTVPFSTGRDGVVWFNNWLLGMNCIDLDDIRKTEFMVRNSIRKILDYCKKTLPKVFGNAYLYDIAPQLGVRCSRRLDGEKVMTPLDFAVYSNFDDVIAWHQTGGSSVPIEIPYSCILPKKIEISSLRGRIFRRFRCKSAPCSLSAVRLVPVQARCRRCRCALDNTTAKTLTSRSSNDTLPGADVPLPQSNTTRASWRSLSRQL